MNFGLRKMQISSAAVPPMRIRPISAALPALGASADVPAECPPPRVRAAAEHLGHPLEADAARALHEHRVAVAQQRREQLARRPSASAHRVRLARERPAHLGGQRADGRRAARRPARSRARRSRGGSAAPRGPSSSMSPSTATRRAGAVCGEIVDRRAHGHRVGVVAVVDQDHPAGEREPLAAQRREAHLQLARGGDSERARGGHRGEQVAQVVRLARRTAAARSRSRAVRANHDLPGAAGRSAQPRSPPSPKRDACADPRAGAARAAARRPGPRPSRRARGRRSAPPWRRRSPRASRAARGATGPTFTITPTSGSAIAVSSAICPAPRIAISSTSTSVSRGRREHRQRQPDLGVEVLRARTPCAARGRDSAARMSLVEVLPVEPVIATTFVPPARELSPPGPRERLQARERDRGARAPRPPVRASTAARACSGATSTPQAPAASASRA